MRSTDRILPAGALDGGRSVLVVGRSMTGKQRVGYSLLADAVRDGGAPISVSTSDPVEHARERFAAAAPRADVPLRVVDCLTATTADGAANAWYVSSPGDLTGVGVALSKAVASAPRADRAGARVLLDSASTLLLYADLDAVYRFLHATAGRLGSIDAHLLSTLHTDALDRRTRAVLVQLFDVVVDVRSPDGRRTEVRVRGLPDVESTWRRYEPARPAADSEAAADAGEGAGKGADGGV